MKKSVFYFAADADLIIEEKGGKYRILDENDGLRPWCNFQKVKEDDEGEYLAKSQDKYYFNTALLEELSSEDLAKFKV